MIITIVKNDGSTVDVVKDSPDAFKILIEGIGETIKKSNFDTVNYFYSAAMKFLKVESSIEMKPCGAHIESMLRAINNMLIKLDIDTLLKYYTIAKNKYQNNLEN